MASASGSNSMVGYLIDNPLYVSGLPQGGADNYQMPTSSGEREDREREEHQQLVESNESQLHGCEEAMFSQMQSLAVSTSSDHQSSQTEKPRPLLPRPLPDRVVFNQTRSGNPFSFTIQPSQRPEQLDWDHESGYEVTNDSTLTEEGGSQQYLGPSHNPAEVHAFFQLRAGELVGLADPQTLDALPEKELFRLISAALRSFQTRRSVFG